MNEQERAERRDFEGPNIPQPISPEDQEKLLELRDKLEEGGKILPYQGQRVMPEPGDGDRYATVNEILPDGLRPQPEELVDPDEYEPWEK